MLRVVEAETVPAVAVIVTEPRANPKPNPAVAPALATVATAEFDELQTADCRIAVLPSLNVPVAVNCSASPTPIEPLAGATAIDTSPAGVRLVG